MKELEKNIINLYGDQGKQWLRNLSVLTDQVKIAHELSNLKPVQNLSHNYILSGLQGSKPVILKLCFDTDALKREAMALKAFAGFGVIKVLIENEGILLIERAVPGISLSSYFPANDHDAIHVTCKCLKRLHQAPLPPSHQFLHIKDWLKVLDNNLNIPEKHLHRARQLRDELIMTASKTVLLHGDLHHDNILQNNDDWLVIDPKGVIGDPAYEVAAFIRNPIPKLLAHNNAAHIIGKRISLFAEILKLSEQRILDWCYVQAILAWAWTLEDNGDITYFKKLTELLSSVLIISNADSP